MARTLAEEVAGIERFLQYNTVDVHSGKCFVKIPRNRKMKAGNEVGVLRKDGYTNILFEKSMYLRHRIVFYAANGRLPQYVDHKHGVCCGDGIENLRESTFSQNRMNTTSYKNSKTGVKGVSPHPSGTFAATIKINQKHVCLGYFSTIKAAWEVYESAAKEHFGSFYKPSPLPEIYQ